MVTADTLYGSPALQLARRLRQDNRQSTDEAALTLGGAKEHRQDILISGMIRDALGATGSSVIIVVGEAGWGHYEESAADFVPRTPALDPPGPGGRGRYRDAVFAAERGSRDGPIPGVPITSRIIRHHSDSVQLSGRSGRRSFGTERTMGLRISDTVAPATAVPARSDDASTVLNYVTRFSQVSRSGSHPEGVQFLRSAGLVGTEEVWDVEHRRNRIFDEIKRLAQSSGVDVVPARSGSTAGGAIYSNIVSPKIWVFRRGAGSDTHQENRALEEAETAGSGPLAVGLDAPDVGGKIAAADDVEGILENLRAGGLRDLAGQLEYKKRVIEDDPDEMPISLESARCFAAFVVAESLSGSPNVTVDPYGYVGLEWVIPDPHFSGFEKTMGRSGKDDDHVWGKGDGVLGVWFLPTGMVRVYGTSGPVGQGVERLRVNSTVTPGYVINEVKPFLYRLEAE